MAAQLSQLRGLCRPNRPCRSKVDVLIVGAGPAGCSLGLLLRRAGMDVLIAEAKEIRGKNKLCGGVLMTEACHLLTDLYGKEALGELQTLRTEWMVCHAFEVSARIPRVFHVLPRERLDAYCLTRYREVGGLVIDRVRLVGVDQDAHIASFLDTRSGERLQISYGTLVGADGASSAVRRAVCGRPQRVSIALQGSAALAKGVGADEVVSDQRTGEHGTCWYIQYEGSAAVGCLFHHASVAYARERLVGFCTMLGLKVPDLRGAPIPTGDDVVLSAGTNTWFVGDAAGLINASSGAGIHYAFRSAQALAEALRGGTSYENAMDSVVRHVRSKAVEGVYSNVRACLGIVLSARQRAEAEYPEFVGAATASESVERLGS